MRPSALRGPRAGSICSTARSSISKPCPGKGRPTAPRLASPRRWRREDALLLHNLRVAWKSLRRNTLLTTLIISGIALGIGISTTFAAVRHSFARDPIPQKSRVLYYVRLDSWDPLNPYPGDDPTRPPTQITYRDMVEIMRSKIPARQGGMFKTNLYVYPDAKAGRPFRDMVRLCFADFFPMFDVPFLYGSGWDARADAGPEAVVVLSREMNDRLFGGVNSVGKTVRV